MMNRCMLALGALALLVPTAAMISEDQDCMIVIDAGSSGSRLSIFHTARNSETKYPQFAEFEAPEGVDFKSEPGISSQTPSDAAATYTALLKSAAESIPRSSHADTRVFVGATAGMRLLDADAQNDRWDSIRAAIEDSAFELGFADTLSGEEEALFGWLAVNWLAHRDAREEEGHQSIFANPSFGALDLGGASTQAAFVPDVSILENKMSLGIKYGGENSEYKLYLNSWMRSGQDQAHLRTLKKHCKKKRKCDSPCDVAGHVFTVDLSAYGGKGAVEVTGTGDWDTCYTNLKKSTMHLGSECLFDEDCAFNGAYFPRLPQGSTFYGYAAFFYSMNGIGGVEWKGSTTDLSKYMSLGKEWCSGQGSKTGEELTEDAGYAARYCFASAYSYAILVDAYGFQPNPQGSDAKVIVSRKVNGVGASWAFGMALYHGQDTCHIQMDASEIGGNTGPSGTDMAKIATADPVEPWYEENDAVQHLRKPNKTIPTLMASSLQHNI